MSNEPKFRVISQQSDTDIAAHSALADATSATALLLANLMRVLRGAGKPSQIVHDADTLVASYQRYFDLKRCYPGQHVASELRNSFGGYGAETTEWDRGLDTMVRGALQMAASRLLKQRPPGDAGERQLMVGMEVIEKIRKTSRSNR